MIVVDGIEIMIPNDKLDEVVSIFKSGVHIDDLEGWQTEAAHEEENFEKFITEAREFSNMSPPDIDQFEIKARGAASICVVEFFLKHFGILIKSNKAKSSLMEVICFGLSSKQAVQVIDIWMKAEKSDPNYYENYYDSCMTKEGREATLDSINEMAAIFDKADLVLIEAELKIMTSVTLRDVKKDTRKIGNYSYDYSRIAFSSSL
ncbi:BTB domain-containing protein [Caenorhabditis elegans]|nr:BTB domain-containing protein [Caenorhabditis elegans]CAD18881.1 BTB domain-containing protein [Caenorhabditis elegans]|eukprot:NP_001254221.1 Uncharacterized protein CELE_ZK1320.11 [Caenorhabditis elegans]